jgi:hypothetical protein
MHAAKRWKAIRDALCRRFDAFLAIHNITVGWTTAVLPPAPLAAAKKNPSTNYYYASRRYYWGIFFHFQNSKGLLVVTQRKRLERSEWSNFLKIFSDSYRCSLRQIVDKWGGGFFRARPVISDARNTIRYWRYWKTNNQYWQFELPTFYFLKFTAALAAIAVYYRSIHFPVLIAAIPVSIPVLFGRLIFFKSIRALLPIGWTLYG